jgi:NADPH-dependent glutamate synthase beta subunit-like oxidoreductase
MVTLKINNQQVEVEPGTTILEAAAAAGVRIPTMCFLKGYAPSTSCMVCVVEVKGKPNLVPSCGAVALDSMEVITDSQRVLIARTRAIELLLSDHVGDCVGPCQVGCPANMDIPLMIKQIAAGQFEEAIRTVKKDIALPAVLGRICPAPCEKVCRRAGYDQAVSICLLKRYVADVDLASEASYVPGCKADSGKKVAVIGAGPAGLAAAYYLQQAGHGCVVFDDHEKPGGMLRYGVSGDVLSEDVIDGEIALIEKIGVRFQLGCRVGREIRFETIRSDFDAVFIATGSDGAGTEFSGIEMKADSIKADKKTYAASLEGVFAGGDVTGKRQLAVRAVADGKEAAIAIDQYLRDGEIIGSVKRFNSRMGKCEPGELDVFVEQASRQGRMHPEEKGDGFTPMQTLAEAKRCLHCQCRKPVTCKLRELADALGAKASKYKSQRRLFEQYREHADMIYEPGKCIDCGVCVQITKEQCEELGLTFVGRGFDVRPAAPFGATMKDALKKTAKKCVESCPTGALAMKE